MWKTIKENKKDIGDWLYQLNKTIHNTIIYFFGDDIIYLLLLLIIKNYKKGEKASDADVKSQ